MYGIFLLFTFMLHFCSKCSIHKILIDFKFIVYTSENIHQGGATSYRICNYEKISPQTIECALLFPFGPFSSARWFL